MAKKAIADNVVRKPLDFLWVDRQDIGGFCIYQVIGYNIDSYNSVRGNKNIDF